MMKGKKGIKISGKRTFAGVCLMLFLLYFLPGGNSMLLKVMAEEYSITPANMILYTNEGAVVYGDASLASQIITVMNADLPVSVTGITSNGWYQVSAGNAIYYIPGNGLHDAKTSSTVVSNGNITKTESTQDKIQKMIKGTFSFYSKIQLDSFSKSDLEEMSVNEYIKYLDSFLAGKSDPGKAIKLDTGLTIQREFDTKQALHATMTAQNVTEYLMDYRNSYLMNSFWGPVETVEDVKVCINRAIRYDISQFTVVCHEYEIGDNEVKMKSLIDKMLSSITDEQGITYTVDMSYGTFVDQNGNSASGFILKLKRK